MRYGILMSQSFSSSLSLSQANPAKLALSEDATNRSCWSQETGKSLHDAYPNQLRLSSSSKGPILSLQSALQMKTW